MVFLTACPSVFQETLETLHLGEPGTDDTDVRDKRTIGPLRQLFPGLSQIVDRKIQQITRSLFRVIGRLVLGGNGGNSATAGASSSSSGSGRKVSITLPTYPPGEDDDEDEDEDSTPAASTSSPSTDESSTPAENENQLAGAESQISEVRVQFNDKQDEPLGEEEDDLKPAASGDNLDNEEGATELENETDGAADDENRNKRFLPFNLGGAAGGGSGGGSGNFLFDIIRWLQRMADTAARVTGKVYRVVAGTDNAGLGFKIPTSYNQQQDDSDNKDSDNNNSNDDNKSSASNINTSFSFDNSFVPRLLIAGSGTTQAQDEAENAPLDGSTSSAGASASASVGAEGKDDGYQEGVPGPITRLFVIANRGIANLVQDLILRLAQTSERLVNFKARLITSII
ncbi:hypothetical protein ONE63_010736 [Megalurothrips usitatus]|uniref:Uncharacterized protein n=1 Tax=Megalurothrips usitatus TaxID=439358 RepID=A0AAV7XI89_9NEOP|nr:hypothetical protein ONE63_010736 [Megalurothrips usitatus]